jgi:hypothetical protein
VLNCERSYSDQAVARRTLSNVFVVFTYLLQEAKDAMQWCGDVVHSKCEFIIPCCDQKLGPPVPGLNSLLLRGTYTTNALVTTYGVLRNITQ